MWALLFPGQGSQTPGMGRFLFENFKLAKEAFEEASDHLKIDFKKLCFDGPEDELGLTENTQPALLLVSVATYKCLNSIVPLNPIAGAGHSIGEYAALVTSGAVAFSDALAAVRIRGQAMQSAVPLGKGGMTAVMGLEPEQVEKLCLWASEKSGAGVINPANFNAPGQIVISGSKKTLEWLQSNYTDEIFTEKPKRVKFIPLAVSAPFHCEMMKPAEEKMAEVLSEIRFTDAKFPIVQNVNAKAVQNAEELRTNVIKQVSAPVRWIECAMTLKQMGVQKGIECGAGKVLSGLMKKIDSDTFTTFNTNSLEDLKLIEDELAKGH